MKILYVQEHHCWGSAEQYLQILIEGIQRKNTSWPLTLLCAPEAMETWQGQAGKYADILPQASSLSDIIRQIKDLHPDWIHFNNPTVKAMVAGRLAGAPNMVITYHSASLAIQYNWKGKLAWHFASSSKNLHWIALTESNKNLLCKRHHVPEKKISVITHGLKPESFEKTGDSYRLRKKLGFDKKCFVLIIAARLSREKAHELLLNAVHLLNQSARETIQLIIAGEGTERTRLEDYSRQLGVNNMVHFWGHRNDIPQLLHASDAAVLCSDFEGLPYAILEAMACGKPVIATRVPGNEDLVTKQTGLLVPKRDVQALSEAIHWLMTHREDSRRMGKEGQKRFLTEFTAERMVLQTEQFYYERSA